MPLNTQSFQQIVSQEATTIQAQVPQLSNFNPGTLLRALIEAVAGVVMYLQNLIVAMYATARAATSNGADLDSWMADFGLTRLPAVAASGQVTFSRFNPASAASIAVGTQVESSDGTQVFQVIADTTNPNYSASANAYTVAANTASVNVTVQAVVADANGNATASAGTGGNVAAGALNTLSSPIVGIDTVTNASAFTNGVNVESDPAFRTRFQNYLAGLGEGTTTAITNAIASLQSNLTSDLTENLDYSGTTDNGYFYAVVDDGSGSPPSQLLTNAAAAVNATRACGIRYGVFGPSVVTATISMTITTASGYTHATVVAAVVAAVTAYVNSLGVGVTLPYLQLAAVAFGVSGVTNVSSLTLNSGTSDLTATAKQVIKAGTVTVT